MYDILEKLFDKLGSDVLPGLSVSVKLGLLGGIILLVLFFICWAISSASNIAKYTKLLIAGSRKFAETGPITDENVDVVYEELKKHPEAVSNGWSVFLEQRVGAPSDYFPARDVLSSRELNGKRTLGASLFTILGTIVWVLVGLLGYFYYGKYEPAALDLSTVASIIMMLEFLIIPIGMFIILHLSLDIVYGKKIKRMTLAYASFCETLDNCVVVTDKEEEAFVTDNLAEINRRVEELIAGRMDDEIIEVVTVPKTVGSEEDIPSVDEVLRNMGIEEEKQEPEPVVEEAPQEVKEPTPEEKERYAFLESALANEEFVKYALANEDTIYELLNKKEEPEPAPAVDLSQMTKEESYEWVENVLLICEMALHDEKTDPQDLESMGELMEQALATLDDPTCQAALTDYLGKLAERYYQIVEG